MQGCTHQSVGGLTSPCVMSGSEEQVLGCTHHSVGGLTLPCVMSGSEEQVLGCTHQSVGGLTLPCVMSGSEEQVLGLHTSLLASYKMMIILTLQRVTSDSEEQKVVGFIHQSSGLVQKDDNFNFTESYIRFRGAGWCITNLRAS